MLSFMIKPSASLVLACLSGTGMTATSDYYSYETNGADWGTIHDGKWSLCDTGKEQSPIDLRTNAPFNTKLQLRRYNYFDFDGSYSEPLSSNKGRKVNFPTCTRKDAMLRLITASNIQESFAPAQLHFHAPSEHTVDGRFYDLEVHFVHTGTYTSFAVVGVFFDVMEGGSEMNPFISDVLEVLRTGNDPDVLKRKELRLLDFFDTIDQGEFWSYPGSFTTPPCTEGVRWSVLKEVQPISRA